MDLNSSISTYLKFIKILQKILIVCLWSSAVPSHDYSKYHVAEVHNRNN